MSVSVSVEVAGWMRQTAAMEELAGGGTRLNDTSV